VVVVFDHVDQFPASRFDEGETVGALPVHTGAFAFRVSGDAEVDDGCRHGPVPVVGVYVFAMFPLRNRVIAGLCRAVIVVEAAVTGGALITATLAMEYGITVFAVPGDVDRETSVGTNLLIRDGAHPVLDPDDLIEELALILGPPAAIQAKE
jgi:hypothetical protein